MSWRCFATARGLVLTTFGAGLCAYASRRLKLVMKCVLSTPFSKLGAQRRHLSPQLRDLLRLNLERRHCHAGVPIQIDLIVLCIDACQRFMSVDHESESHARVVGAVAEACQRQRHELVGDGAQLVVREIADVLLVSRPRDGATPRLLLGIAGAAAKVDRAARSRIALRAGDGAGGPLELRRTRRQARIGCARIEGAHGNAAGRPPHHPRIAAGAHRAPAGDREREQSQKRKLAPSGHPPLPWCHQDQAGPRRGKSAAKIWIPSHRFRRRRFSLAACWLLSWFTIGTITTGAFSTSCSV